MSDDSNTLVFATGNHNKVVEINKICPKRWKIISLIDLNHLEELEESGQTLKANALQKAEFIHNKYHIDCFAEDTGLEIKALNRAPGVYSARYAGQGRDANANMNLVLEQMKDQAERSAQFHTVIAFIHKGSNFFFEGVTSGKILRHKRGNKGFGYDPIFQPEAFEKTFAEMSLTEKAQLSHRSKAFKKLMNYLNKI